MFRQLLGKLKESLLSILPVTFIVIILYFTPLLSLTIKELITFIISAVLLIIGISFFNLGADIAMQPMGEQVGVSLIKTHKGWLILLVAFVLGLLITIAEPDLSVLAQQVSAVINNWVLIVIISIGVGVFLVIGVIKIVLKKDLAPMLMFFYLIIFALVALVAVNGNSGFICLSFDSGGVTTGPITVPFIMALGVGIASSVGGKNKGENSFGLIALCSIGPVLMMNILGVGITSSLSYEVNAEEYSVAANVAREFLMVGLEEMKNVGISLGLIVISFMIIEALVIKLPKRKIVRILIGILYTFIGLVVFLTAANVGFLPVGFKIGTQLFTNGNGFIVVLFGFVIGLVVVLAEPAIHTLTKQVEEITNGGVTRRAMLIALCAGVGISIGLSMIRIIFKFSILWYLIPGYVISLGLSFFVPKLYTAIAFDSGGVASGPLTSSFILPFAIGICSAAGGDIMQEAFGVVAMVAMTPLITIQLLGFTSIVKREVKDKSMMKKIINSVDDEQIINF